MTKPDVPETPASSPGHSVRDRTATTASSGACILLIDDNPQVARAIALAFDCAGHAIEVATGTEEAFSLLARRRYDAILLDLNFTQGQTSGAEGFAALARIVADDPGATIMVITAHSGIRVAVAAMQAGACDFVIKPWRNADLVARVEAAIARRERPATTAAAAAATPAAASYRLLGDSPAIVAARGIIGRIAPTGASVLVTGPSGSGRSLAAALIHDGSPYADRPAVRIDARDETGWSRIDRASGTLVVRDADRLDPLAQTRLLDRLPDEARTIAIVDDPWRLTPRLHARLGTILLALPPLADRGGDAMLLARHFARVAADRHDRPLPSFTPTAETMILGHRWIDEVRGLALAIERAVLLDDVGTIDAAALAPALVRAVAPAPGAAAVGAGAIDVSLAEAERVLIETALRQHRHNVSQAAAALGLSRQALYRRMSRHGI